MNVAHTAEAPRPPIVRRRPATPRPTYIRYKSKAIRRKRYRGIFYLPGKSVAFARITHAKALDAEKYGEAVVMRWRQIFCNGGESKINV